MTPGIAQTNIERINSPWRLWLKETGDRVLDFFFPPHCVICRHYGAWFCLDCQQEIELIHPPICHRCGSPLADSFSPLPVPAVGKGPNPVCRNCRTTLPRQNRLLACAYYTDPLKEAIRQFKYSDLSSLAAPLGKLMASGWIRFALHTTDIDVIVPVPLHPSRERQRGYNQSALLARELGTHLHLPVVEGVLVRTRATAPQVDLSREERRANVRNAFSCVDGSLAGQGVLLVDDVYTSGSTMDAAYSALQKKSVSYTCAFALAKAK
jgi:competence protein ComFC